MNEAEAKLRYRITVKEPIVVPNNLRYLFYSKTEVPPGTYECTVDVHRIDQERDVQGIAKTYGSKVDVRVLRTII